MKKIIVTGLPGSEKTKILRRQIPYFIDSKDVRCLETQKGLDDIITCENRYDRIVSFLGSYHDRLQEAIDDKIKMLIIEDHPKMLIRFFEELVTPDQYRTLEQLIYNDPLFKYDNNTYYHFCDETYKDVLTTHKKSAFVEFYRLLEDSFVYYERKLIEKKNKFYNKGKMTWDLYL